MNGDVGFLLEFGILVELDAIGMLDVGADEVVPRGSEVLPTVGHGAGAVDEADDRVFADNFLALYLVKVLLFLHRKF